MKIIFYIDMMGYGGAQRVMCNLANYFAKKNYEVMLINDAKLKEGVPVYDVDSSVTRYYLKDVFEGKPIKKNVERIFILRRIIKKEKPNVIVSFLGNCNIRMLIATFGLKCKKIVSVRNDPQKEYGDNGIKKVVARNLFRLADGCVFQTGEAQRYFPSTVQRKSIIIYNPVDKLFFDTMRQKETKDIVTFGRLEKQKNHKLLIDAYAQVCEKFTDNLYIYGEGPLREELQNYIVQKGLEKRVFLPGSVCNVNEILAGAKLFALTSNYEGMPNALMEALAVGVPSISTDCPVGGPEMLFSGELSGYLVPCGDVEELVEIVLKVLSLSKLERSRIGTEMKNKAFIFKPEKVYLVWENFLKEVCRVP